MSSVNHKHKEIQVRDILGRTSSVTKNSVLVARECSRTGKGRFQRQRQTSDPKIAELVHSASLTEESEISKK